METSAVNSIPASCDTISKILNEKDSGSGFEELLACLFLNLQQPVIPGTTPVSKGQISESDGQAAAVQDVLSNIGKLDITNIMELLKTIKQFKNVKLGDLPSGLDEQWLYQLINNSAEQTLKPETPAVPVDVIPGNMEDILKALNNDNAKNPINVNQMQKMADKIVQEILSSSTTSEGEPQAITVSDVKNKLLQYIASLKPERALSHGAENQIDRVINDAIATAKSLEDIVKIPVNTDGSTSEGNNTGYNDTADSSSSSGDTPSADNEDPNLTGKFKIDVPSRTAENAKVDKTDNPVIRSREDLVDVVANKFKTIKLPEVNELNVKLRPKELGDITIKVTLERGQINGSINASNKEVANVLQNQIDMLKQDLKNNGVNLNNITVNTNTDENFNNNQSRNFFNQGEQKRNQRNFNEAFEEAELNKTVDEEGFEIMA